MLWASGMNGVLWAGGIRNSAGTEGYWSWFLNDELESNRRKSLLSWGEEHVEESRRMNVYRALGEPKVGPEWLGTGGSQRLKLEVVNEPC